MLKALKASSIVVMIVSVCTVAAIIVFGFKDNPEIRAFLQKPGIVEQLINAGHPTSPREDSIHPLLASARDFADRIDPYIPPITTEGREIPEDTTGQGGSGSTNGGGPPPPPPPPPPSRFTLLATVLYESAPEKSLALFETGYRQEWFRPGEKVDRYHIKEIKNGRVILFRQGQKPQELAVPEKPKHPSLLKDDR